MATRGGIRRVRADGDGDITVSMGSPRFLADRPIATAAPSQPGGPSAAQPGIALEMPNPHVVVPVAEAVLDTLDLTRPPQVEPALPQGQNVEFVTALGPRHLRLRVHERGVGETRSCGTGICAAAVATAGPEGADGATWRVDVPGGTCHVRWREDGEVELTGPAVLIGTVEVDPAWLAAVG